MKQQSIGATTIGHTVEFREMIVRKALSKEMTQKELIEEYGVGLSTLHKWLHAYKNQSISKVAENEKPARDWNDDEKSPTYPTLTLEDFFNLWIGG